MKFTCLAHALSASWSSLQAGLRHHQDYTLKRKLSGFPYLKHHLRIQEKNYLNTNRNCRIFHFPIPKPMEARKMRFVALTSSFPSFQKNNWGGYGQTKCKGEVILQS